MKLIVVGLLLAVLAPASWGLKLWGIDVDGVEVESSFLVVLNSVGDSAPDPWVNTLGISVPVRLDDHWVIRSDIQAFVIGYSYANGRAVPESSAWDNVSVLSIMVNPTGSYEYRLTQDLVASADGGLGFLLRFPVFLNGSKAGDMAVPVTTWLLAGRFIYPNIAGSLAWKISPKWTAVVRGQFYYPVFDLWGGTPWYDEMTYGVGIGFRYTF
jgi:hypothetical protein